jgi:hypothetical protein
VPFRLQVYFPRDVAEKCLLGVSESVCFFGVGSCQCSLWCPKWCGTFLDLFYFLDRLPQELSVNIIGIRPCRNVWMLSFLLLMSCLSFYVAALSSRLLSGVRSPYLLLRSLLFSMSFCFTSIGRW